MELFLPVPSVESSEIAPFQWEIAALPVIIEASPPCRSGQSLRSLWRVVTWVFSVWRSLWGGRGVALG